jgi:hypothetical protein|nr:MAG TPA: hypothetical protein [Caudoviricetes sp.]
MKKRMKEHIVFVENVKKDKSYVDFDIEAVIDELKDNGFNVTKKPLSITSRLGNQVSRADIRTKSTVTSCLLLTGVIPYASTLLN